MPTRSVERICIPHSTHGAHQSANSVAINPKRNEGPALLQNPSKRCAVGFESAPCRYASLTAWAPTGYPPKNPSIRRDSLPAGIPHSFPSGRKKGILLPIKVPLMMEENTKNGNNAGTTVYRHNWTPSPMPLSAVLESKIKTAMENIAKMFADSVKSIAPAIGVCIFGYMIGSLFADLNVAEDLGNLIASWNFGKLGTVIAVCLITCFMGMVIPGSSLVVIFGGVFRVFMLSVSIDGFIFLSNLDVFFFFPYLVALARTL